MGPYKTGLKILFAVMRVTVQFRSRVLVKKLKFIFSFLYFRTIMFYTYILYSAKFDRFYIGQCEEVAARLLRNNNGGVPQQSLIYPGIWFITKNIPQEEKHQNVNLK